MASKYARLMRACPAILAGSGQVTNTHAASLSSQGRHSGGELIFFCINGPRNMAYWGGLIKAFCWGINDHEQAYETVAASIISFLYGFLEDPRGGLVSFARYHRLRARVVELTITHGTLIGVNQEGADYIEAMEDDALVDHANYFKGRPDMTDLAACGASELAFTTIIHHIFQLATKAVTAPTSCIPTAERRLGNVAMTSPAVEAWILDRIAAEVVARAIARSMPLRSAIVALCHAAESDEATGTNIFSVIHHASSYLKMAGMTGYSLVCKYVIRNQSSILLDSGLASQVHHMFLLLEDYLNKGADAPYTKFLNAKNAALYNPSNFQNLYQAALGIASHTESTLREYNPGEAITNSKYYTIGRSLGEAAMGIINHELKNDLGLHPDSERHLQEARDRAAMGPRVDGGAGREGLGGLYDQAFGDGNPFL